MNLCEFSCSRVNIAEMSTETLEGVQLAPHFHSREGDETLGTEGDSDMAMSSRVHGVQRRWRSEPMMTPRGSRRRGRLRRVREHSSLGTHVSTIASDHEDDGLFAQVRQRDDISLFTLTKQFVLEIKKQHDCLSHHDENNHNTVSSRHCMELLGIGSIDLNTMAEKLCVQKRRVYDMTCVLEGIGLLVKKQKNVVTWMPPGELLEQKLPKEEEEDRVVGEPAVNRTGSEDGGSEHESDEIEEEKAALQRDVAELAEQEKQLSQTIKVLCRNLQAIVKKDGAWMRADTLLRLFHENLVLVIHAPPGTELRVPDPFLTPTPKFQLKLSSNTGAIRIRVLRNNSASTAEVDHSNTAAAAAAVADPQPPLPLDPDLGGHERLHFSFHKAPCFFSHMVTLFVVAMSQH